MDYPVVLEGFEDHEVVLRADRWGGAHMLLFDGEVAPRGPKRNQYLLPGKEEGSEVLVRLRPGFFDPVPQILIDRHVINVVEPLRWYELVWCFLPLALVFTPGIDGFILAFAGSWINHRVFRSTRELSQKYLLTAAITVCAVALYFVLSGRLRLPSPALG